MEVNGNNIIDLSELLIGYSAGRSSAALMPPITSCARAAELIALVGPNGVGKSTLLRTIAGLQGMIGGTIRIKNKNLADYGRYELARCIGYISTETIRVSNMTVFDLVALGRLPHTGWTGRLVSNDYEQVDLAIRMVEIEELAGRYVNELSDGERQKAMIARVLAQDAEILVMDEPTAFLDITSKYEIVHLLHDLSHNKGKTIIFSTHDLLTAIGESDKIWLAFKDSFREGIPQEIIHSGELKRLFSTRENRFFESVNKLVSWTR
jgi:iron complex transport system ATP-binding protein